MDTIVESMERREQVEALIERGCDLGEGSRLRARAAADVVLDPANVRC